jgi:hypothetical protein
MEVKEFLEKIDVCGSVFDFSEERLTAITEI